MKANEKVNLCDSLAIIILSRLLKRNGVNVTPSDLDTIESYIEQDITTFTEKWLRNTITIRGLSDNSRMSHTQTMLPYVNSNEKLKLLMEKLDIGDQRVDILVEKGKVVCKYLASPENVQEISFTVISNRSNDKIFGLGHQMEDYGYTVHSDYLVKLFGLPIDKSVYYSYIQTASNEGTTPTHSSILKATRELYANYAKMLSEVYATNSDSDYFITFTRLVNGLHATYKSDDDFEVYHCPECKVTGLNYETLFSILKLVKIDVTIAERQTPVLKVFDTIKNKLIFQIKMKSKKSEDSPTGRKYFIYFESGDILSFIMNNKTETV